MRKQPSASFNPWNFSLEEGQRVYQNSTGLVYDLKESRGRNKKDAGELTPVIPSPIKNGARAVKIGEIWYWEY